MSSLFFFRNLLIMCIDDSECNISLAQDCVFIKCYMINSFVFIVIFYIYLNGHHINEKQLTIIMIPKVIYQTWKTQNLLSEVYKLHQKMLKNVGYKHIVYTDEQMNDYMQSNAASDIKNMYFKLNNIVAKVDVWRYTILLNKGGVYLDIDSEIIGSLSTLINEKDEGIITAENKNLFVQWH